MHALNKLCSCMQQDILLLPSVTSVHACNKTSYYFTQYMFEHTTIHRIVFRNICSNMQQYIVLLLAMSVRTCNNTLDCLSQYLFEHATIHRIVFRNVVCSNMQHDIISPFAASFRWMH